MGKKILIVEDDKDTAKVLSKRLMTAGYDVMAVHDAFQGIQEAHKFRPDLILLDLMLPAGGGLSVLGSVKESYHTQNIPFIVLTGSTNEENRQKALSAGAESYIQKPYDIEVLQSEIRKILKES